MSVTVLFEEGLFIRISIESMLTKTKYAEGVLKLMNVFAISMSTCSSNLNDNDFN